MRIRRGRRGTAAAAAAFATGALLAGLVLAGPGQTDAGPPISLVQKAAIREDFTAAQVAAVRLSPGRELPRAPVGETVSDFGWLPAVGDCLARKGFNVEVSTDRRSFQSDTGGSLDDYQVAQFECFLAHPSVGDLLRRLDEQQLGALHGYWAGVVRPCLAVTGQRTPEPPSRELFVMRPVWNPFAVPIDRLDAVDVRRLETSCRPVPPWLNITDAPA